MVIGYCFRDEASQEVLSSCRYLSLHNPKTADASGLLQCIQEALKLASSSWSERYLGEGHCTECGG